MDVLPSLSSFTTSLLSFCAIRIPPSLVAIIPSALLPSTSQISFHFSPAATTLGISVTVYSLGPGGAAGGRGPGGRPPLAGGGTLQVFSTSGSLESFGACTPGPDFDPAGDGIWPSAAIATSPPKTTASIPIDFIKATHFRVPEYQDLTCAAGQPIIFLPC